MCELETFARPAFVRSTFTETTGSNRDSVNNDYKDYKDSWPKILAGIAATIRLRDFLAQLESVLDLYLEFDNACDGTF